MVDEHPNTELFWLLADVAINCCLLLALRFEEGYKEWSHFPQNSSFWEVD